MEGRQHKKEKVQVSKSMLHKKTNAEEAVELYSTYLQNLIERNKTGRERGGRKLQSWIEYHHRTVESDEG